jgi:hypothetical protein
MGEIATLPVSESEPPAGGCWGEDKDFHSHAGHSGSSALKPSVAPVPASPQPSASAGAQPLPVPTALHTPRSSPGEPHTNLPQDAPPLIPECSGVEGGTLGYSAAIPPSGPP